ncbi:hypothetical protein H4219_005944 [Mycoemilia scoparia]|uniref:Copper acquisition factor BIM1-like domain-containing protein n=1 Tax=Mycoemilia scoparia TaxID=417184 RepID=A0A9W8DN69_9FUNG|nr:hypothetical protein H4219_005944 [Mycoemilia scoparia]
MKLPAFIGFLASAALVSAHFKVLYPKFRPENMKHLAEPMCGGSNDESPRTIVHPITQEVTVSFGHGDGNLEYKFYPVADSLKPVSLLNVTISGENNYTSYINFDKYGVVSGSVGLLQAEFTSCDESTHWYQCADVLVQARAKCHAPKPSESSHSSSPSGTSGSASSPAAESSPSTAPAIPSAPNATPSGGNHQGHNMAEMPVPSTPPAHNHAH